MAKIGVIQKILLETVNYSSETYLVMFFGHFLKKYLFYKQKPMEKYMSPIILAPEFDTKRFA